MRLQVRFACAIPLPSFLLLQSCGGSDTTDPNRLEAQGPSVTITTAAPATLLSGDVVQFAAEARDASGNIDQTTLISWSVSPSNAGFVSSAGKFVGYGAGSPLLIASAGTAGTAADTLQLTVTGRGLSGTFSIVGRGIVLDRITSDLWVHGTAAYTGTWGSTGNTLNTWDVSDPANPMLTSAIQVDARTVNDVKVSSDGTLGVITHEGSSDLQNGITLLDLSDPLAPTVITRTTLSLEPGVHNAWIDGNFVYVVVDGASPSSGLRILDVSDPSNPQIVASFYAGSSLLHDVYVRDGLAFLSHWDAGLVILDVGDGVAGGSPTNPVEVGRVATEGGQTHNAWYWPASGYVFIGEEDFGTPGKMHVVDVSDLANPVEVATFGVGGTTPHNFWLDETREILYASWYDKGIRAIDVSGELLGELDLQGREIVGFQYAEAAGSGSATMNWAPQLHNGLLYLSDLNSGLWVLRPEF